MTNSKLHDWGQAIGLFAVVASLVFVGLEVRQSSDAAQEDSILNDLHAMIGVEELVTANPGIWLRGCQGELLDPEEQMVFTHIYHTYEFTHFMRWLRGMRGVHVSSTAMPLTTSQ